MCLLCRYNRFVNHDISVSQNDTFVVQHVTPLYNISVVQYDKSVVHHDVFVLQNDTYVVHHDTPVAQDELHVVQHEMPVVQRDTDVV